MVSDDHVLLSFSPVNESVLFHLDHTPGLNRLVIVNLSEAQLLEVSFRLQSESLSHTMWVLSALLGYIKLQGFVPFDSSLFNQLVTSVSKGLAHQSSLAAQFTSYIAHKRWEYYLSLLPAYFPEQHKRSLLLAPAVFRGSLFCEDDVSKLLEVTRSCFNFRSQRALVDGASQGSCSHGSHSSSRPRCRRDSESPPRSTKRMRFSKTFVSSLKSPTLKSSFRQLGSSPSPGRIGGCLAPLWQVWADWDAEDWVVQVLWEGYRIPFLSSPPLSSVAVHLPSCSPSSICGIAFAAEV